MLACVLVVVVVGSVGTAGQEATVSRGVVDVFTISSPDGVCVNVSCGDYETYMVEDGVCVADNTLQRKCSVYLAPVSYSDNVPTTASISVSIADNGSLLVLNDANSIFEEARLLNRQNTIQNDGGKTCNVTGLDVMRGENYTRQINHTGFSVNSGSNIKVHVNKSALPYEEMDYEGELYRMNISCEGNQNVDCVLFKLVGTTDLTGGKFNGAVANSSSFPTTCETATTTPVTTPPTTPPSTTPITTSAPPTTTTSAPPITTRATPTISNAPPTRTTSDDQPGILDVSTLSYIVIGFASSTGLLLCLLTISCAVMCLRSCKRSRSSHTPPLHCGLYLSGVDAMDTAYVCTPHVKGTQDVQETPHVHGIPQGTSHVHDTSHVQGTPHGQETPHVHGIPHVQGTPHVHDTSHVQGVTTQANPAYGKHVLEEDQELEYAVVRTRPLRQSRVQQAGDVNSHLSRAYENVSVF